MDDFVVGCLVEIFLLDSGLLPTAKPKDRCVVRSAALALLQGRRDVGVLVIGICRWREGF